MADKDETIARVTELIQPLLEAQGVELVELQYSRPRRGRGRCAFSWTSPAASPWRS